MMLTEEEKVSGQAAEEAGTADTEIVPGQAGEPGTDGTGEGAGVVVEAKPYYTPEEQESLHPMDIDLERVPPETRGIVKRTINEYKALQGTSTKIFQENAELKKEPPTVERYFEDDKKNTAFTDYLNNPSKLTSEINSEIYRLEEIAPIFDDGSVNPEYRKARQSIAYWNGIKDDFSMKRGDVIESRRTSEIEEARVQGELGAKAKDIEDYAKSLGFTVKEFRSKPELRKSVSHMYEVANAAKLADRKIVRPNPQKTVVNSGVGDMGLGEIEDVFDPNLSTEQRIAKWQKK